MARKNIRFFARLIFCLILPALAAPPLSLAQDEAGRPLPIRMTLKYNGVLTISDMRPFPYDGREAESIGTVTDLGGGLAEIRFPASSAGAPPLLMMPGFNAVPLRVEIMPRDLVGTVDFNTGEVKLSFDAAFQPNVLGLKSSPLSVITELTTGTSSGDFREVEGRPLDEKGDCRLVGVAVVPKTKDMMVNSFLSLPTDAVTEMEVHFDFPEGRPGQAPPTPDKAFFGVGKRGRLTIGSMPAFKYDGKGSGGAGLIEVMDNGVMRARFGGEDLVIPPLRLMPGSGFARVEIETRELTGTIDPETGRIELEFDATFVPKMGKTAMTPISVVTSLTTETSRGMKKELQGTRMNEYGDAFLVGVAIVPKTDDPGVNALLGLPADAACELPVHFDFFGGKEPDLAMTLGPEEIIR